MCRHCWQPIQFFLIALKSCLHLLVPYTTSHRRILQQDIVFISCDNCNLISIQFSQLKVWKPLHRYLDCYHLLKDTYLCFSFKWLEYSFKPYPFIYSYFDCAFWLMRFWVMGYIWFYKGRDWLLISYDMILLVFKPLTCRFYKILGHNVL